MKDGIVRYYDSGWGFYLNGLEYVKPNMTAYKTRDEARRAMYKCKKDMFDLMVKHGCCDAQDEFKKLAAWNKQKNG